MTQPVDEQLGGRPFTDLKQTTGDLLLLEELLTRLRSLVGALAMAGVSYPQQHIVEYYDDGRYFRFVLNNWQALVNLPKFVVVGFCGQRRKDVSAEQIAEIDALDVSMVNELKQHKGMVLYSTGVRTDGDYSNLILFESFEHLSVLGNSRPHSKASKHFSPNYYYSTRIHDGVLDGALFSSALPQLRRTRYWDFTCQPTWQGERIYPTST